MQMGQSSFVSRYDIGTTNHKSDDELHLVKVLLQHSHNSHAL